MDRVRKALDRARLERPQNVGLEERKPASPERSEPALDRARIERPQNVALEERKPASPERSEPALDRARLERPQNVGLEERRPASPERSEPARRRVSVEFEYVRTRTFQPPPEVLERHRVLKPESPHPAASAFRMLRTQVLQRMDARGWRSLAIFSPTAEDGKTTTAINLAIGLGHDRLHTALLVEFDFKKPSIAARLGLTPDVGVEDVLAGHADLAECFYHPDGFERFVVLPARSAVMHSSELLAGPRSREVVAELRARYPERVIIFDLPPVLASDDALAFAPLVECGLVIAAEGYTRRDDLVRTIELLDKTPLVGTVLNCSGASVPGEC